MLLAPGCISRPAALTVEAIQWEIESPFHVNATFRIQNRADEPVGLIRFNVYVDAVAPNNPRILAHETTPEGTTPPYDFGFLDEHILPPRHQIDVHRVYDFTSFATSAGTQEDEIQRYRWSAIFHYQTNVRWGGSHDACDILVTGEIVKHHKCPMISPRYNAQPNRPLPASQIPIGEPIPPTP